MDALTPSEEVDPSSVTSRIEFGARLRALRTASGLSLRELASASKGSSVTLSRSTIEDAELGRTLPRPDWLEVYLAACGVRGPRQRVWKRARAALASSSIADRQLDRLPRIAASDPRQLGVHPAINVVVPSDRLRQRRRLPELPPYVQRDVDDILREAIVDAASRGGLIVVVGGSSTGKTRTAYEAVQAELPSWRLLHPADSAELARAVEARQLPRAGLVVWLDEAQHYLTGPDRLTVGMVRTLLNPDQPMLLLATMWPQWYEQLTTPPPIDVSLDDMSDAEEADRHWHARQILTTAAQPIRLDSFNEAEYARAKTLAEEDPRLATAIQDSHYGPTEVLAAAPQLVDRFEHAANPYAKAVIAAAIDYRRLGHNVALAVELLQTAAVGYLSEQQIASAPADWFNTAINYATGLLHGATSSLIPIPGTSMGTIIGYTVADYLLQYGQATRKDSALPTSFWDAGVSHISDMGVSLILAREAEQRELYQQAILLATPAAQSGDPNAMIILARSLEALGQVRDAEEWYQRAADTGDPHALWVMARWLGRNSREAKHWYAKAAEAGSPQAMTLLASRLERAGQPHKAEEWWRRAAEAGSSNVILALARRLADVGQTQEAERWYRRGAETGQPKAMLGFARWLQRAGRHQEADRWYRHAAEAGDQDAILILARGLSHTSSPQAEEWFRRAADTGNPHAMCAFADWWMTVGQADQQRNGIGVRPKPEILTLRGLWLDGWRMSGGIRKPRHGIGVPPRPGILPPCGL